MARGLHKSKEQNFRHNILCKRPIYKPKIPTGFLHRNMQFPIKFCREVLYINTSFDYWPLVMTNECINTDLIVSLTCAHAHTHTYTREKKEETTYARLEPFLQVCCMHGNPGPANVVPGRRGKDEKERKTKAHI